jgi:hypothetical protein
MITRTIAALLLLAAAGSAQAASLALVPSATSVAPNATFQVNLVLDAGDVPLIPHPNQYGGAIVVTYDTSQLQFGGFVLNGALDYFEPVSTASAGGTGTITFGFDNAPDSGTVGIFTFTALGPAGSVASLNLEDADDFSGSFASYVPAYQRFYPAFVDAQVSVVPLPAGVWLLGTGLGALAARRLRRSPAPARTVAT